jgi:protein TonB
LAAKHKAASTPATSRGGITAPDSAIVYTPIGPPFAAPTPGPMLRPGSPVANRTTIVPFPIPGDTSREAIAHSKVMNVPRVGETLVESTRAGSWKVRDSVLYWDPGDVTGPQKVDVFPEQRSEPAPIYPNAARDAGIQGTVVVMALVLVDGTVTATRVVKSIPALDDAAVDAVKRLRFKPGTAQGKPVPVWVAVRVRFTLH